MARWTEVYQDEHTRRQFRDGAIDTMSRLDRFYSNMPSWEILDCHMHAATMVSATNKYFPSDHVPVAMFVRAIQAPTAGSPKIAKWITNMNEFSVFVSEAARSAFIDSDVMSKVAQMKALFHLAAAKCKRLSIHRGAQSGSEKLHWCLVAARAARDNNSRRVGDAVLAFRDLEAFFNNGVITNEDGLQKSVCEIGVKLSDHELEELEHAHDATNNRNAKLNNTLKRASLWAPMRKRANLVSIRSDDGCIAGSTDRAAFLLKEHWSLVFADGYFDEKAAKRYSKFVQKVPSGIEWRISREEFEALISKLKFSAPGPDGVPFTARKNGCDRAHDVLLELYYFILDGGYPGDEFNHSHGFLGKG